MPTDPLYAGYVRQYTVDMKNITLSLDDELLEAGRQYAERHQTTLNALVRELLTRTVLADRQSAIREMFRLMDANPGNSKGRRWKRDDLYAR
jgi:hypothetical protein